MMSNPYATEEYESAIEAVVEKWFQACRYFGKIFCDTVREKEHAALSFSRGSTLRAD
jgi:hypothetical protein